MSTDLQIDQMTVTEKLRFMEELWEDLRTRAGAVPVPQWHKDVLVEREQLIESGDAQFEDWDTAKKRITEQTS
jgi:hypothetical protein